MVVPGEIINGYTINNKIGSGAFSNVYSATKENNNFCIKIQKEDSLSNEAAQDEIKFFQRLKELQVPQVPQVPQAGGEGNNSSESIPIVNMIDNFTYCNSLHCIVLPLYECNVQKFMSKNYPNGLPWALANKIIKHVLQACEFMHKNGIIHTDIKPENILLKNTKNIDEIEIALTDFGTVKPIGNDYSDKLGTPEFQAPEVIIGYPYNEKIDTWAIACTYYELLTGKYLFDPTGYNENDDDESNDDSESEVDNDGNDNDNDNNDDDEWEDYSESSSSGNDDNVFNLIHLYHMDKLLGCIPIEMTTEAHYSGYYFTKNNKILGNLYQPQVSIRELVNETVKLDQSLRNRIIDFLQQSLVYDPAKRASATQLLESMVINPGRSSYHVYKAKNAGKGKK
jgi:serine/threonine protein kinase